MTIALQIEYTADEARAIVFDINDEFGAASVCNIISAYLDPQTNNKSTFDALRGVVKAHHGEITHVKVDEGTPGAIKVGNHHCLAVKPRRLWAVARQHPFDLAIVPQPAKQPTREELLQSALFDVLDALGVLTSGKGELRGYGISEEREAEIIALVEVGK